MILLLQIRCLQLSIIILIFLNQNICREKGLIETALFEYPPYILWLTGRKLIDILCSKYALTGGKINIGLTHEKWHLSHLGTGNFLLFSAPFSNKNSHFFPQYYVCLPQQRKVKKKKKKKKKCFFFLCVFFFTFFRDHYYLLPRSHIHGLDARLATHTILHHSWQSVLVRSFPSCIRNHT